MNIEQIEQIERIAAQAVKTACEVNPKFRDEIARILSPNTASLAVRREVRNARRLELLQADQNLAADLDDATKILSEYQKRVCGVKAEIEKRRQAIANEQNELKRLHGVLGRYTQLCRTASEKVSEIGASRQKVWREWNENGYANS